MTPFPTIACRLARSLVERYPQHFSYYASTWDRFPDNTDHIKLGGLATPEGNMIAGANAQPRWHYIQ